MVCSVRPSDSVGIVLSQETDNLVGLNVVPHLQERGRIVSHGSAASKAQAKGPPSKNISTGIILLMQGILNLSQTAATGLTVAGLQKHT